MPSGKDRLCVALHLRGGKSRMPGKEDRFHWALFIGPRIMMQLSSGIQIHVKNTVFGQEGTSVLEERESSLIPAGQVLIRVVVAKIQDRERLPGILRTAPVTQDDSSWNCISWVREALATVQKDGEAVGTSKLDWQEVRDAAMGYCQEKIDAHRFDGKGQYDMMKTATYDLLERKKIVP
ncbi:uncharacterized protein LTR77_006714 [Saxophila tyrrhenica]|uniref:Uncharacterized protein n=1 Tax=Saxophila tyrrhenica TaxID=1690608 RepID=A0AAV9P9N5_9PEZI|nr:hypothetical protein LTR77_006714 [Saxophila tyrrhenica]